MNKFFTILATCSFLLSYTVLDANISQTQIKRVQLSLGLIRNETNRPLKIKFSDTRNKNYEVVLQGVTIDQQGREQVDEISYVNIQKRFGIKRPQLIFRQRNPNQEVISAVLQVEDPAYPSPNRVLVQVTVKPVGNKSELGGFINTIQSPLQKIVESNDVESSFNFNDPNAMLRGQVDIIFSDSGAVPLSGTTFDIFPFNQ